MPQLLKFSICSTSTWNGGIVGKIDRVRQRAQEAILDRREAAPQESEDVREEVTPSLLPLPPRWEVTPSLLHPPPVGGGHPESAASASPVGGSHSLVEAH